MEILVYLLLVVAGAIIGIAAARLSFDKQRVGKVEAERDAAKQALADYRQQVTDHFQHTGELFDRITADYRSLYEHLAAGASELCDAPRQDVLHAEPERRRLTDAVTEGETATGSAVPDPVRAGVAGAAAGAAAAAATTTGSTPDETEAAGVSEAGESTAAADASETGSAQEDTAADADAEPPLPRDVSAADGEAREDASQGDGEATATAAEPAEDTPEDETDHKPALAVNGHYRAESPETGRKAGAP